MRLICKIDEWNDASNFSILLIREGVPNKIEPGHDEKGPYSIWIYEEEDLDKSRDWFDTFMKDPKNPEYSKPIRKPRISTKTPHTKKRPRLKIKALPRISRFKHLYGPVTIGLLIICIGLFLMGLFTNPVYEEDMEKAPVFGTFSTVEKFLLYDFPETFEFLEKLVMIYGPEKAKNPEELPREGQYLFKRFSATPYWFGFYDLILAKIHKTKPLKQYQDTLFEKIRQGEIWRIFTPSLLHGDLFHLLFNMIWLILLGSQIEHRVSSTKFFLLIFLIAGFSNTAQYLMSGPVFLGFSGVVCGLVTFIWTRQRSAPWEGYFIQRSTLVFVGFFVFAMFAIQFAFFLGEMMGYSSISSTIANTAHISGGIAGIIAGRTNLFATD